jgi:hypothetical protein
MGKATKKAKEKKTAKKAPSKYDEKIKVNATFGQLMSMAINKPPKST